MTEYHKGFQDCYTEIVKSGDYIKKDEVVAMLTDIKTKIHEKEQYYQNKFLDSENAVHEAAMSGRMFGCGECKEVIRQKINELKGEEDEV